MKDLPFYKHVRRIELVAARLVDELLAGNYRSTFKGRGKEFDEVREYVPGDDVRAIDWNVTSRMSVPYTKIFREERELTLFLIVDVSASLFSGSGRIAKSEFTTLVSAILSLAAVMNDDRVGAVFFSDRIERWVAPARGRKHVLRLINDLLRIKPAGRGSDLALALRTVYKNLKRRGICLIVSDFKTKGFWDVLSLLAKKHDCIAAMVFDPVDVDFPSCSYTSSRTPSRGRLSLPTGPPGLSGRLMPVFGGSSGPPGWTCAAGGRWRHYP